MELLSTALSTLLGKVAVGTAVAAASVAGMDAADVIDVPGFEEKPEAVDVGETPPEPGDVVAQTPATDEAAPERHERQDADADDAGLEAQADVIDTEGGEPDDNAAFGQRVAADAQDGGVVGQDIATEARAGTPAEGRAAQPDAPGDMGERQDADVRQDADAPHGGDVAEEQPPAEAGSQADAHRPSSAGPEAAGSARP